MIDELFVTGQQMSLNFERKSPYISASLPMASCSTETGTGYSRSWFDRLCDAKGANARKD